MSKGKPPSRYAKPISYAGLFLVCGVIFLILSRGVVSFADSSLATPHASPAPATSDADDDSGTDDPPPTPARNPATSLSGILLMFSVACFLLTGVCIGWIVQAWRKSRPAWKTQTKYPKHH